MKKVVPNDAVLIPAHANKVFEGIIYDVYQWPQKMFDGSEATFEMLKRPDTTTVICVARNKIIVIDDEQPNSGVRKGFPGGRVNKADENIIISAQREVLEEVGYRFNNWRLIKVWQPYTKLEWFIHFLLAWDIVDKQPPAHEAGERISINELTFEEVKNLIITHSGYLGENQEVFEKLNSLEELLDLPEFEGQKVDR